MSDMQPAISLKQRLGNNRIYLLFVVVFAAMSLIAPNFLTINNQTSILKGMSLNALLAIGLTMVMISGKLDLSIGTTLTLGGVVTIGLQPHLGWTLSIIIAVLCGGAVGLINGLLVARAKVDSFIATLGTMIITQGLVLKITGGATFNVDDFAPGMWLEKMFLPFLTPRIIIAVVAVLFFELMLQRTRVGRGYYMVGGNATAAWHAGLSVDSYVISAFTISGLLSSLGGSLFSISISSATPIMGNNSLMVVIAAVIIGGTSMAGGKGSVFKSMAALIVLTMLFNGFSCMGAGWEVQKISSGVVLASVIIYDAYVTVVKNRLKGKRHELLEEMKSEEFINQFEGSSLMNHKDNTKVMITAIAVTGCVAIVAIFAMYFIHIRNPVSGGVTFNGPDVSNTGTPQEIKAAKSVDTSKLFSTDGQPLFLPDEIKQVPSRPNDPSVLPEDDALHWYDMEYAGWNLKKINIPKSPGDGPAGKQIIFLKMADHPYQTAYSRGIDKIAKAYGIKIKTMVSNSDINVQAQQADQAINEKPDLVIINPVDAQACTPLLKKINDAGIPIIASNLMASNEALQYCLSWTGPDDWGQFRKLAHEFAKLMNYEGGYCIIRHRPGGSCYFSRTYAMVTELKKIAPKMELLAMQTTDLEAEKTMQVVSDWLTRFGPRLKGIVSADDSGAQIGINEAVRNANREDIVRVAAGNSKVGMDFIKAGTLHAITYQSAEADGALPVQMAVDWFSGKVVPPVRYLPIRIITRENVGQYLPAQW